MAVAFGSAGTANAGTTSISVTLPATVNAGDLLVLHVVNKYPSNGPAEPTGWTTAAIYTGGSGSAGTDSGQVYSTVFTKVADGTEGGTSVSVSLPSANASRGMAWRWTNATGGWSVAVAGGSSNTPGNWNTTMNANPGITSGDLVLMFSGVNGDAATSWSAEALTVPSCTVGTLVERHDATTAQGDDLGMFASEHPITAGTATGVATYTATRAGSTTANSPAGATALLRLREVANANGSLSQTLAAVTVSGTGAALAQGSSTTTLDAVTGSATATSPITGTVGATLDAITGAGAGAIPVQGALGGQLDDVTVTATSATAVDAQAAITLASITGSASATAAVAGTLSRTLADVAGSGGAQVLVDGVLNQTLADVAGVATAIAPIAGEAAIALDDVAGSAAGQTITTLGVADLYLDEVAAAASGTVVEPEVFLSAAITLADVAIVAAGEVVDPPEAFEIYSAYVEAVSRAATVAVEQYSTQLEVLP